MKRLLPVFLLIALLLTACAPAAPSQTELETTAVPTDGTTAPEPSQPVPLTALSLIPAVQTVQAEDGAILFSHSYQSLSLSLENPAAAQAVSADLNQRFSQASQGAEAVLERARQEYAGQTGWVPFSYDSVFTPVRLDRSVLSLLHRAVSYTGGSHANTTLSSITYDLYTGQSVTLEALLVPEAEGLDALLLEALVPMESELFPDYAEAASDKLTAAISSTDGWYLSEKGLCFFFSPYEIAPYSAGTVTAEIPYEALTGIMADSFFPPESLPVGGTVSAAPFSDPSGSMFYGEAVLDEDAPSLLLTADGTVQSLRLKAEDGSTILLAASLSPGQGILVQSSAPLLLAYASGGKNESFSLRDGLLTPGSIQP